MVSKTDDEMYVLRIIKIYSYYSFVFSVVPLKIQLKKYRKLLCRSLPPGKIVDKKKIIFLSVLTAPCSFQGKRLPSFVKYPWYLAIAAA